MDSIGTAQIAEALMRSGLLAGRKIEAIKILRNASRDASGESALGLREAKEYIDNAVSKIVLEQIIRDREALATELLTELATLSPWCYSNDAAFNRLVERYQSHITDHGVLRPTVKYSA